MINAAVRADSRTKILTDYLLSKLEGNVETIDLNAQKLQPLDDKTLAQRDALIKEKHFDYPMFDLAKQFMAADIIVMCAPMWDLSFPAALKQYIEHINVLGVTFEYTPAGGVSCDKPTGLTVNEISANSAVISWTSEASAFYPCIPASVLPRPQSRTGSP